MPNMKAGYPAVACWTVKSGGLPFAYPPSARAIELRRAPRTFLALPLDAVLRRRFLVDTWFQALTVSDPRDGRWPRFSSGLLLEPTLAARVSLSYAVLDLDRPDHRSDPWSTVAEAAEAVRQTSALLDGASVYATRGGLRALWRLATPVPLTLARSFQRAFVSRMAERADLPVPVDYGVRDWTRGYRVPWSPRGDGKPAAWGDGPPPMEIRPLIDGVTLPVELDGLEDERAVRTVPVRWPDPSPYGVTDPERRIGGIARAWAGRIAEAPSRHAVLLAAGRHLGGLCARYGCSPLGFAAALAASAGDSSNARATVEQALAFGAHEPTDLPPDDRMPGIRRGVRR